MKTITFTSLDGDTVYFREQYSVVAINGAKLGSQHYTEIITNIHVFRVRDSVDEVAQKFGWLKNEPTES